MLLTSVERLNVDALPTKRCLAEAGRGPVAAQESFADIHPEAGVRGHRAAPDHRWVRQLICYRPLTK